MAAAGTKNIVSSIFDNEIFFSFMLLLVISIGVTTRPELSNSSFYYHDDSYNTSKQERNQKFANSKQIS